MQWRAIIVNNILKYWILCELSDFESFKMPNKDIKGRSYLEKLDIRTFDNQDSIISKNVSFEYLKSKNYPNRKLIDPNKSTNIYKLFLGFIKVEEFIRFLYEKSSPALAQNYENELERINSEEYTYVGYVYLDYLGNLISIENRAISINPIFYILKNIKKQHKLNNFNYNLFIEKFNDEFSEEYKIKKVCHSFVVPSFGYLMKTMKPKANNYSPFNFLEYENSKIIIHTKLFEFIKKLASDESSKYYKKALIYYDYLSRVKNGDAASEHILFIEYSEFNIEQDILQFTIDFSLSNSSSLIYYLTDKDNQLEDNIKIPINMYIYEFLNKEMIYPLSFKKTETKDKIAFEDIQKNIMEEFEVPKDLLYKNTDDNSTLFIGIEHKKAYLNSLKNIVENQMISFYVDALKEEPKKLTLDYIEGKNNRIDVNASIENRKKINDLKYFKTTVGKWASRYPLYYAQQAAVNLFLFNYNQQGNIFSINGPPGTGKTTLLKDVVANIVIKRVQNILDLNCKVFDNNGLNADLVGKYEVVVTSNNNAAVENISLDLPKKGEFDFEYLEVTKDALLLSNFAKSFYRYESWSLFSIRLGRKANFDEFKANFADIVKKIKEVDNLTDKSFLNSRLSELKKQFHVVLNSLRKDEKEFESFDMLQPTLQDINSLREKVEFLNENIYSLESKIEKLEVKYKEKNDESLTIGNRENSLRKRVELKKENLSSFGFFSRYITKREVFKSLRDEVYQLNNDYSKVLGDKLSTEEDMSKLLKLIESKRLELDNKKQKHTIVTNNKNTLETKYNQLLHLYNSIEYNLPDDKYFSFSEEKIQKDEQIYGKKTYLKNKVLLFLISLQISEVVFLLNIDNFTASIDSYLSNYRRKDLLQKDLEKLQKDFSSLFFIFPVVSTTLASSYSMLKNISDYGTLICDESGQATPQSLVGALNRANNALIVGDPLQVEPVFTVPEIVIRIYNDAFNINPIYSPITSSAQQLADNANEYGSYYEVQEKKVWVGMPLVVHRRCLNPMFMISNEISYNEKMVLATSYSDTLDELPESCWIDVVSNERDFNENSSTKEREATEQFIDKYKHLLENNYYIISPFKSINKMFKSEKSFEKIFGTVHTFQGKEADVVFIVLGGRTQGSKAWAAQKANILNVALTRAKKRVYIVGDYDKWKVLNYFKTATRVLPRGYQR